MRPQLVLKRMCVWNKTFLLVCNNNVSTNTSNSRDRHKKLVMQTISVVRLLSLGLKQCILNYLYSLEALSVSLHHVIQPTKFNFNPSQNGSLIYLIPFSSPLVPPKTLCKAQKFSVKTLLCLSGGHHSNDRTGTRQESGSIRTIGSCNEFPSALTLPQCAPGRQ